MTISVLSDLHCHGEEFPASFDVGTLKEADVLVVAGDIGTRDNRSMFCDKLRQETKGKFRDVILVYGNHDYYTIDHRLNDVIKPGVYDNFVVTISDNTEGKEERNVDFVCTPLWSPITNHDIIRYSLNDYNYIPDFTTHICTELFFDNLKWLEDQIELSKKNGHVPVIVTHHLPRRELISPEFVTSDINEAFCVMNNEAERRLNDLKPVLWIHGHSHNFMDKTIDGTRYVRNPYGYEYGFRREITGYQHNFIVTI